MRRKGIPEFNIAVLGAKDVGKSSLVQRFLNNTFTSAYSPTTKIELYTKVFDLKEQKQADPQMCILNIYDCFPSNHRLLMADPRLLNPAEKTKANVMNEKLTDVIDNKGRWEKRIDLQDDYLFVSPELANLKYAIHAYIFVYAIDQPDSISIAKFLYELVRAKELSHQRHNQEKFKTKLVMVGNKQDNRYGGANLEKMLKEFPDELKFMKSLPQDCQFFASAMTNYNVNKVFKRVCEKIYEDRDVVKVLERKEKREDLIDRVERRSVSFLYSQEGGGGGGFFSCCGSRKEGGPKRADKNQGRTLDVLSDDQEEQTPKQPQTMRRDTEEKKSGSKCAIF